MSELRELQCQHWDWASKQFAGQPVDGKINHLIKELDTEVRAHPESIREQAGCFLIWMGILSQQGIHIDEFVQAVRKEFDIVRARKDWGTMDEKGIIEHNRTGEALPPFDPEEWVFLRAGDVWLAGDHYRDGNTEYVVGSPDTTVRDGQMVTEAQMKFQPRRHRSMPIGGV
jgi:hypothetical protein